MPTSCESISVLIPSARVAELHETATLLGIDPEHLADYLGQMVEAACDSIPVPELLLGRHLFANKSEARRAARMVLNARPGMDKVSAFFRSGEDVLELCEENPHALKRLLDRRTASAT